MLARPVTPIPVKHKSAIKENLASLAKYGHRAPREVIEAVRKYAHDASNPLMGEAEHALRRAGLQSPSVIMDLSHSPPQADLLNPTLSGRPEVRVPPEQPLPPTPGPQGAASPPTDRLPGSRIPPPEINLEVAELLGTEAERGVASGSARDIAIGRTQRQRLPVGAGGAAERGDPGSILPENKGAGRDGLEVSSTDGAHTVAQGNELSAPKRVAIVGGLAALAGILVYGGTEVVGTPGTATTQTNGGAAIPSPKQVNADGLFAYLEKHPELQGEILASLGKSANPDQALLDKVAAWRPKGSGQ